ncbi:MAG: adenylate/guanylate cyclase domain-containing protein, partial [Erysipelotrichaceae bacterium]|nr:adenylate/guanylate cyclase domain-containing protein [Erysipelotrichaceae bacterium]
MPLKSDLENKISTYFRDKYEAQETTIIPSTDYSKLTFGNKGLVSELCFLFVDIRESSKLHEKYGFANAARIYQSFHDINVRIINHHDGKIRAFDGDRIMGVFSGDTKCTSAVKSAMKINWSIRNILNKNLDVPIKCGIGIDFGKTLITKVGKGRDENNHDLIWVGQACNYASHYCQEGDDSIIISSRTFNRVHESVRISSNGKNMWTNRKIVIKSGKEIDCYESSWGW